MAEFASPDALVAAVRRLKELGYRRLDAFTPFPVKAAIDALTPPTPVPAIMLVAGLSGGALGYLVQWWCAAIDFPINVGGRPLNSAPAFIPITFESAVLFASVAGFVALLVLSRLPRLYHPVFELDGFDRASVDRFWIAIDEADDVYSRDVRDELARLGATKVERMVRREP
jgi:hypothetical protein